MTTVLVVDDEPVNCALLDAMLSPEGYEVRSASSGEEALAHIAAAPPDLVLLDLAMPGIDGVEACRRIRAMPGGELIPVVVVTAHGERESRIRAKAAGADDFLAKPVDDAELLARVKNLTRVKALHDLRARRHEALTRELAERSEQLLRAERLATVGTLASAVGHELNNLDASLALALRGIEHAVMRGEAPSEEDLAAMQHGLRAVRAHATQLLSLGRPGAERVEVFDLADLLREVLGTLRSIGRLRGVDAEFSLPEEGVAIVAARVRVSQVFLNLLLNAADAVAAVTDRPKVLRVRVRLSDGRARCAVDDSGPGITDALAERVFEPWFTTKPVGQGTGLGLLVVRHIVEGYGGTVLAARAPEGGASFQFDLPAI